MAQDNMAPDNVTPDRMSRDGAIDIARGIAMILVVLGHALWGTFAAGHDDRLTRFLLIAIYSIHMPLFFAVSGLLSGSMARRPWPEVLRALTLRIVWPYMLWSVVILLAGYVMRGETNAPVTVFAPWTILWKPPSLMWFLYVLFLAMLLLRLLAPLPRSALLLVGGLLLAASFVLPVLPVGPVGPVDHPRWIGVFLLSAWVGPGILGAVSRPAVTVAAALTLLVCLWLAWRQAAGPLLGYPASQPQFLLAYVAGPALILGATRAMAPTTRIARALAHVGRTTMAVFVLHVLITAGTRIALRKLGWDDPVLAVVTGTGLGVLLPLMAAESVRRAGLSGLFGWR